MGDQLKKHTAACPECGQELHVHLHALEVGHLLLCSHCEEILYVVQLDPLRLDWAFEEPTHTDLYHLYPRRPLKP